MLIFCNTFKFILKGEYQHIHLVKVQTFEDTLECRNPTTKISIYIYSEILDEQDLLNGSQSDHPKNKVSESQCKTHPRLQLLKTRYTTDMRQW